MPNLPPDSLAFKVAARAEQIVNTLAETDYQYTEQILPEDRVYRCDCNSFVGFVLEQVAPQHYARVPVETGWKRPRAWKYYEFFAGLGSVAEHGWERVSRLPDARRGDVMAWRLGAVEPGQDTGHVLMLAETPGERAPREYAVRVYDSASKPHFEDTRGDAPGRFANGVGSGFLRFRVDEAGAPTAFLFSPEAEWTEVPIAIGRAV